MVDVMRQFLPSIVARMAGGGLFWSGGAQALWEGLSEGVYSAVMWYHMARLGVIRVG